MSIKYDNNLYKYYYENNTILVHFWQIKSEHATDTFFVYVDVLLLQSISAYNISIY